MRCFADTNVIVAVVTEDDDRADDAIAVLNDHEMHTSVLNLMELRSVLAKKKKQFNREHVERIEDRIVGRATVTFPDASDIVAANRLQRETYLYPMDALILAAADAADATLLSFDAELREHGAKPPEELL
jgi:predicted nucleic acid-binding protein